MCALPTMLMIWVILKYKLTKIRRKTYHSAQKEDLRKNIKALLHWAAYCSSHTLIETYLYLSSKMSTHMFSDITVRVFGSAVSGSSCLEGSTFIFEGPEVHWRLGIGFLQNIWNHSSKTQSHIPKTRTLRNIAMRSHISYCQMMA